MRSSVSSGYFQTIRQPVLEGRAFTDHDDAKALPVAVINQTMARHRWRDGRSGREAHQFRSGQDLDHRSSGSWADAKEYGLDRPIRDEVYTPVLQNGFGGNLVVRTAADPMSVASAGSVRAARRRSATSRRSRADSGARSSRNPWRRRA